MPKRTYSEGEKARLDITSRRKLEYGWDGWQSITTINSRHIYVYAVDLLNCLRRMMWQ